MKKMLRSLLCAGLMTALLSIPAFAADTPLTSSNPSPVPERQGDFYVLVNGDYVTFTDAVPKIKNDRSCLPFVATFEQLGFAEKNMTWDGDTKTVTATKDDTTISLTIGKQEIALTQAGKTEVIPTNVAPYIEPALSRTYIPFGLVADVLGYNVGWDADQRTVIIDDVDAILAANDETYTLMDKYLAYGQSFSQKNQKVSGGYTMNMDMSVPEAAMYLSFLADGDYEMLMANQSAFQFSTDMALDVEMQLPNMTPEERNELEASLSAIPASIDMDLRGDLADGVFYVQSAALAQMMEQPDMANAWFKLDMKAMFDQMDAELGMSYADLMKLSTAALNMNFEEYLAATLKALPLTSADATASDVLTVLNAFCADNAFTKNGSSYVNTMDLDGVKTSFILNTSGSKVNGYSLDLYAGDLEDSGMEMAITASMRDNKLTMEMGMGIPNVLTITMSMDGAYQAVSAKPVTAPPANAVIIDLMQMMPQA